MPLGANIAIIAVLAVIATVLSYLALQSVNEPDPQGFSTTHSNAPESVGMTTPVEAEEEEVDSPAPVSEPTPETEVAQSTTEQIALGPQSRLIALDGSLGVRADVGECTNPGSIEFSTDGGQNWTPSSAFDDTSGTQILRILPANGGTTFVVALNADCTPQIYSTTNSGSTWNGPLSSVGTWYLNPATPSTLGAPGGARAIACEAVGLSPVTDRDVGVLCADGSVLTTADGGTTWSNPQPVEGITALAYSRQNLLAVATGDENCHGVQLMELGTDDGVEELPCVEVDPAGVTAGEIALAESGNSLILWAGEKQYFSMDGGQTWL
ncbi:WD40/YVTN/BNR-like repeat-containing protein [Corynebacterium glutamicum]|uniref:WD40/YVTN/BNR-like repeat-containing protein n=1 Tax=Corynebacterium glutamicum TaxID=1718 RepID=UPI000B3618AD|nr:hypothetical protein [Corynebacterium glutamicum]